MINWELLNPRNVVVIGVIALISIFIFNHFANKDK